MATPNPLTHTPQLILSLATLADIPPITALWYTCFSNPLWDKLFPTTPALYAWWNAANSDDLLHKASQVYLKVTDESAEGKGKIVGYAKWGFWEGGEERMLEDRLPGWAAESDAGLCDVFFGALARERRRVLGESPRGHVYLDMLCTLPEYRKLGVARLLIEWGCEKADAQGKEAYVDATEAGKPVYMKFGFEPQKPMAMELDGQQMTITSFLRPAKKQL
ncbi:hypothetical protein LOCC1_G004448 [Lachnellula occidentalis]|uniref:N-acetyltransferase domain-containing protein n=1 Tax=Lachnellula occidentalis TaxID=215460 RepID=A0A8H8RRV4_9HELO|nr:hypothetical protein LOCC1_G004448 [Lachnellula occidentalis]